MRPIQLLSYAIFFGIPTILGSPPSGAVSGRVEIKEAPPQKVASRYPLQGGEVQRSIEPIPTVVFIQGPVAGAPGWPESLKTAIVQNDLRFSPSLLVIPKHTSVSFPNEDSEFHNVFSYSKAKRFDLGRYPKGETKSVVFDKSGIVKVYCEIHPWMRAVVLVLENPFYAIVSEDGTYSIQGIPPGHYDLVVWNIDEGSRKLGVDVQTGRTPEVVTELSGSFEPELEVQVLRLDSLDAKAAIPEGHFLEGACCAGRR